jgi:protein SCO1/2
LWLLVLKTRHDLPGREITTAGKGLPVYFEVKDFALTNQNNQPVTLADLRGKVWVADIIFTRCTGPCPKITRAMKQLQDALSADPQARLVTLTSDPEYDSPPVLKAWADHFGAKSNRWLFLTGTRGAIREMATDGLKLVAVPKDAKDRADENDLFIHSTIFVLIDRQGRCRGSYETYGEGVDFNKTKAEILDAIRTLEGET